MDKVISGFPGIGKSHFKENTNKNVLDSDSSKFSWFVVDGENVRNPDFPKNYIAHIKENIDNDTIDYILVSSHKEVREALEAGGINFALVYPKVGLKELYLARYAERGSPKEFITMIDRNWVSFIYELDHQANCLQIVLENNQYLSDVIE